MHEEKAGGHGRQEHLNAVAFQRLADRPLLLGADLHREPLKEVGIHHFAIRQSRGTPPVGTEEHLHIISPIIF